MRDSSPQVLSLLCAVLRTPELAEAGSLCRKWREEEARGRSWGDVAEGLPVSRWAQGGNQRPQGKTGVRRGRRHRATPGEGEGPRDGAGHLERAVSTTAASGQGFVEREGWTHTRTMCAHQAHVHISQLGH